MRLLVGLVFITRGYIHLKDPTARAKVRKPQAGPRT